MFQTVSEPKMKSPLMTRRAYDSSMGVELYYAGGTGRGGNDLFVLHIDGEWVPVETPPFAASDSDSDGPLVRRGIRLGSTLSARRLLVPLELHQPSPEELPKLERLAIEALLSFGAFGDGLTAAPGYYQIEQNGVRYSIGDFRS